MNALWAAVKGCLQEVMEALWRDILPHDHLIIRHCYMENLFVLPKPFLDFKNTFSFIQCNILISSGQKVSSECVREALTVPGFPNTEFCFLLKSILSGEILNCINFVGSSKTQHPDTVPAVNGTISHLSSWTVTSFTNVITNASILWLCTDRTVRGCKWHFTKCFLNNFLYAGFFDLKKTGTAKNNVVYWFLLLRAPQMILKVFHITQQGFS